MYLLEDEISSLLQKRESLQQKYNEQSQRLSECMQQGADTWHDNFDYEDATRIQSMLSKQIGEVDRVLNGSEVLNGDALGKLPSDFVRIGKQVLVLIDGKEESFLIGGYQTELQGRYPYNAPLIRQMLGRAEGEEFTVVLDGNRRRVVEILEIS